ncbi:MAG: ABC transporter ATP-binding protein [Thermofilaceae archaeon]
MGAPAVLVKARVEYLPGIAAFEGSFEADGGFTIVIGPNGAGKTTLLHAIAGILSPYYVKGDVRVLGANPYREYWVKKYVALARQEPSTFDYWCTVETALTLYALLKGEDAALVREVVEELGLQDYMHPFSKVGTLSFGTRRKLEVAKLFLSKSARVYLLDELIGLDPPTVNKTLEYLRSRAEEGACVILVTHDPRHLQMMTGGRVVVLKGGRVLRVIESRSELEKYLSRSLYEMIIVVEGGDPRAAEKVPGVESVSVEAGARSVVRVRGRLESLNSILEALMGSGCRVHRVEYDEITPLFEE